MKVLSALYQAGDTVVHPLSDLCDYAAAQLVLCFGSKSAIEQWQPHVLLRQQFPQATLAICSTAGEIYGTHVYDHTLSVTAIQFAHTPILGKAVHVGQYANSAEAGRALLDQFDRQGLRYVMVLSDGSTVNGSELAKGLNEAAGETVLITGGLAGDGNAFESTWVGLDEAPQPGRLIGIGFYGDALTVRHGTQGGWETFGTERVATKAVGNVLYEIDGKKVLDIYKKYLGPEAAALPGSALLFPLSVTAHNSHEPLVRTILSVDEAVGSMTFAGDIPQGAKLRLMKANFDKLTTAAAGAAQMALGQQNRPPKLALLISCVGRKLILQNRIEEEVEAIEEVLGQQTLLTGFYSYGEISPFVNGHACHLHNQTMTITTFDETE